MGHGEQDTKAPMLGAKFPQKSHRRIKQYLATIAISFGGLCAGTCLAWSSPVLPQLDINNHHENSSVLESFYLTDTEQAKVGSMISVGALISAIPAGYIADKIGRKKVMMLFSALFVLNWTLIVFAKSALYLIVGRLIAGFALGAVGAVCPMYIGEIAESSIRGILSSFFNMFICGGILLSSLIGALMPWRDFSMMLATFPVMCGIMSIFMPETPVFLVKKNKLDSAEKSLRSLRDSNYDIYAELKEIHGEIETSKQHSASIKDILRSKGNRKAFLCIVSILGFQQLCGVNAVVFYTVSIFENSDSFIPAEYIGVIISVVQMTFAYISVIIIEKGNRKFFLMASSIGMMLFQTAMGMYFHLHNLKIDVSHLGFIPLCSSVLYMVCFAIGYGPVPWLLMGELFSPEIKGVGNGCGISISWVCAFLVTYSFPILKSTLGLHVCFYILAVIMGLATVFVAFVVPETRGKTLLEIQQILNK